MTQINDEDEELRRVALQKESNTAALQQSERELVATQNALRESNEQIERLRQQADSFLSAARQVLEMIATGKPLGQILHCLALETEGLSVDGMLCSILLMDESGQCLRSGAAPSRRL